MGLFDFTGGKGIAALLGGLLILTGCDGDNGSAKTPGDPANAVRVDKDPFPSTYASGPQPRILITNATLLTAAGPLLENAQILLQDGKITALGQGLTLPDNVEVIDASGKWVTPGIIDVHSHLGVYPSPGISAVSDGNESTSPITAEVWAEHSVWPQDPGFTTALAGGITTLQILPGSANLIGGRSVVLKNVPARTVQDMKYPGAPYGLKMACGENPKRVYGSRNRAPSTRMGNVAGYRAAWIKAQKYQRDWDAYYEKFAKDDTAEPPARDLQLETLAGVLEGEILVHNHCYRADEMAIMIDIAKEFGYSITSFQHAVEAYKIGDLLAENNICAAMWADWWGSKLEMYDGIRENIPFVDAAGACAIVHSDDALGIQRLNQEAAKAMSDGQKAGLQIEASDAIRWLTINAATSLGIGDETGSLEVGKNADLVIWSGNPFSVYAKAEQVFIDGVKIYDRSDPDLIPLRDFELGQSGRDL